MVWCRGHPGDYDDWAAAGNQGWGWGDVLPAYRAVEDYEGGGDDWRGAGGPLHISANLRDQHALCDAFYAAAGGVGLAFNADYNGATQEGVGPYQLTVRNGRRNSAARAFLRPAMRRANVEVRTRAHVTRILFEGRRAVGVAYTRGGRTVEVRAREVILSGGAVNSPQLLMLSGVGPAEHLRGMGIAPVIDNANVGAHLSDHQGLNYTWSMKAPRSSWGATGWPLWPWPSASS